jgi:hypothetical protein
MGTFNLFSALVLRFYTAFQLDSRLVMEPTDVRKFQTPQDAVYYRTEEDNSSSLRQS